MNGRELERVKTYLNELRLVVGKTTTRAAERECGTKNYGVAYSLCRFLCLFKIICYLRGNGGFSDRLAKLLEELSVLGSFYTLA